MKGGRGHRISFLRDRTHLRETTVDKVIQDLSGIAFSNMGEVVGY